MAGSGANGAESDARTIATLRAELTDLTLRGLELELRITELEANRWRAYSLVELEWLSGAFLQGSDRSEGEGNGLPAQANQELERRARLALELDDDPLEGMR